MKAKLLLAPAILLSLALAGCTGTEVSPNSPPAQDAAVAPQGNSTADTVGAQAEEGLDVGNSRPVVSYDGLMVRRRVVIAVNSEMDADLAGLRTKLETAAAPQGMALADISPDVLEPAVLEGCRGRECHDQFGYHFVEDRRFQYVGGNVGQGEAAGCSCCLQFGAQA